MGIGQQSAFQQCPIGSVHQRAAAFLGAPAQLRHWLRAALAADGLPELCATLGAAPAHDAPALATTSRASAGADAPGGALARAIAGLRLELTLQPPAMRALVLGGGDSAAAATLSGTFATLLTLSVAARHLHAEMRATRSGGGGGAANVRRGAATANANANAAAAAATATAAPGRAQCALLHAAHFAVDALLRFVATEVDALAAALERRADAEARGRCSLGAIEAIFADFVRGLRGVALFVDAAATTSATGGGDGGGSGSGGAGALATGVARAIASHGAALCAFACDPSRAAGGGEAADSSGVDPDAAAVSSMTLPPAARRVEQYCERETQRLRLACNSLVAALRGLRIDTDDPVVERQATSLLTTLTFNRFF